MLLAAAGPLKRQPFRVVRQVHRTASTSRRTTTRDCRLYFCRNRSQPSRSGTCGTARERFGAPLEAKTREKELDRSIERCVNEKTKAAGRWPLLRIARCRLQLTQVE
jgi:hypothetical protein